MLLWPVVIGDVFFSFLSYMLYYAARNQTAEFLPHPVAVLVILLLMSLLC